MWNLRKMACTSLTSEIHHLAESLMNRGNAIRALESFSLDKFPATSKYERISIGIPRDQHEIIRGC